MSTHRACTACTACTPPSRPIRISTRPEARKAEKALAKKAPAAEPDWVKIDGMWPAYAVDGKGHHDGDGKYTAHFPVADFGVHLYLGAARRASSSRPLAATRRMSIAC